MSAFLDGLGKILGKVSDQFQGRIERLKNEKTKLTEEKRSILANNAPITGRQLDRVLAIDKRVAEIRSILENNARE